MFKVCEKVICNFCDLNFNKLTYPLHVKSTENLIQKGQKTTYKICEKFNDTLVFLCILMINCRRQRSFAGHYFLK